MDLVMTLAMMDMGWSLSRSRILAAIHTVKIHVAKIHSVRQAFKIFVNGMAVCFSNITTNV